jgi:putative ABC transport system permease protein
VRIRALARYTLRLLWRPTRVQLTRAVLIALALSLATGMPVAFVTVTRGAEARLSKDLTAYGANISIEPAPDAGVPLAAPDIEKALTEAGVRPSTIAYIRRGLAYAGRQPLATTVADARDLAAGDVPLAEGRWPSGPGEVVVGRSGAGVIRARTGGTVTLSAKPDSTGTRVRIVGAAADVAGSAPSVWLTAADKALVAPDPSIARALLRVDARGEALDAAAAAVQKTLPQASVRSVRQVAETERRLIDRILLMLGAVGLVVVLMTVVSVTAMTSATLLERIPSLGLMRALGATRTQVALLLGGEIVLVGLGAGVVGYFIAGVLSYAIGLTALASSLWPGIDLFAGAVVGGMLLAALAATAPAAAATRISPADALKA